ncbi:hypothetical protein SDC9_157367 [bioreactor metagenome]|uniref:Uncharacterized protein n=1 Tax=bioreactor metagenome TaxID=1076179 RepID=A0A645FBY7_9ZZZZ
MLGDVALGRSHGLDDVLDADFAVADDAQNLQAQRVRHGLQGARRLLDMLFLVDHAQHGGHSTRSPERCRRCGGIGKHYKITVFAPYRICTAGFSRGTTAPTQQIFTFDPI